MTVFMADTTNTGTGEAIPSAWIVITACGIISYLAGAIPFGLIVARTRGIDIRQHGSRNIGATNVFRVVGRKWGILTLILDALKGLTPTLLFPLLLYGRIPTGAIPALKVTCAMSAVAGHNWPVYLKFKGGKGVATSAGVLLGLAPLAMAVGFGTWIISLAVTRYVSVSSILASVMACGFSWYTAEPGKVLVPATLSALACAVIIRHKGNIKRLINGTENRFSFRKSSNRKQEGEEKK